MPDFNYLTEIIIASPWYFGFAAVVAAYMLYLAIMDAREHALRE